MKHPLAQNRPTGEATPQVVFIMGTARSGSTLLGTLLDQAPGVFYTGELCDWPERAGMSTVPQSASFWAGVRARVGEPPTGGDGFKAVIEHPRGMFMPMRRRAMAHAYRALTLDVLEAVAIQSDCGTIVDSSHYPRRAGALRRILGRDRVRLIYLVRRPSDVARSFRETEDKGELAIQLYLFVVGILAWATYLTHPRTNRALISYETLVEDPILIAAKVLGRPLHGVDVRHLKAPRVFIGNRFVKEKDHIALRKPTPHRTTLADFVSDLIQWPLHLAGIIAGRACENR